MRRRSSKFLLLLLLISSVSAAQSDSVKTGPERLPRARKSGTVAIQKGSFYFAFGYNKDWYSTSDVRIHDESGDYDFTIHDLKAHDHPHFEELLDVALSIPQYGYRMGYWLPNQKYGIEIKFDHAKYIVYADQYARVEGKMNDSYVDTQMVVTDNFMHLEHTDGANFLMLNGMYRAPLCRPGKIFSFYGEAKFGIGMVVPRSDVTLFGQRWNHCFHVAGWITGIEAGVRIEILRYFFIEPSIKGGFANYKNVLAIDDILISHRFWTGMVLLDAGFQFPLGKRQPCCRLQSKWE
jgi:hypothetical protein